MKESKEQTSNFPDLSKINVWFLLPIAVLMSELLTLLFSEIYSLLFFGTHLQMEFVLIGMWDSGLVSLIAVGFIIFIMDRYHKLRENYISLYEENKSRKEFTEKLNISEKRYRAIYEQAALGIFNLDKNGRFLQSNKRFCDMLGYTEEELSIMTYLDVTHDEDKAISSSAFKAMSNEIMDIPALEKRYIKKDGSILYAIVSGTFIKNDNGEILYSVSTVNDITEIVSLRKEKENISAGLRNQQKLEAIGTLAGGVAHEINNPLNGIMNYGQLIADMSENSDISEYSNEIIKETERIAKIVKNLLAFSRQSEQTMTPHNVHEIIDETLSLVRTILRKSQITIDIKVPKDLPAINCKTHQLGQVIMNLVTNARDALNDKYPGYNNNKVIFIKASEKQIPEGRFIDIVVEDHGNGIPENIHERIFDPFFTTKGPDKGTGLGLSISYGIVKEHGGYLELETEKGRFTRFHILLPVAI